MPSGFDEFSSTVKVMQEGDWWLVESNGLPAHGLMRGITSWQQQVPVAQPYNGANAWRIPAHPVPAASPVSARTSLYRGAIALAANGVPIFNALNTTWDLRLPVPYKDGGSADDKWELTGIRTQVVIDGTINKPGDTDRKWTIEMALPMRPLLELRDDAESIYVPRNGEQWRINFSRVEWRHQIENGKYVKVPNTKEDNWVWSPQGVIDMHRPERWGKVRFTTRLASDNPPAARQPGRGD